MYSEVGKLADEYVTGSEKTNHFIVIEVML